MKMKKYYPILLSRAEKWFSDQKHQQMWADHVTQVIKDGKYHVLEVRLAWDMAYGLATSAELSEWAHDCDGNDKHLTTLFIKVAKDAHFI